MPPSDVCRLAAALALGDKRGIMSFSSAQPEDLTMKNQTAEAKTQTLEQPIVRKVEEHARLLENISADARELANRYPRETIVPEGGE